MSIGVMRKEQAHLIELTLFGLRVAAAGETLVERARMLCNSMVLQYYSPIIKCAQLTCAVCDAKVLVSIYLVMLIQIGLARADNITKQAFDFGFACVRLYVR